MKAILQLIRLPNVFTVVSEILMAWLVVHPDLTPWPEFLFLLGSSVCLYWGGMVLNDWFDVEQDQRERPDRPIPSGRISKRFAAILGWGLLAAGVALAGLAGFSGAAELPWRSPAMAGIVAVCIVLYDGLLKKTMLGPLFMGGCRWGNVLLGMSTGAVVHDYALVWGYDAAQFAISGGIGLYIAGVTFFARNEAAESIDRRGLFGGLLVILAGLAWLGAMTIVSVTQAGRYDLVMPHHLWPLAVVMLSVTIVGRCLRVVMNPTKMGIQLSVKNCIISLVVLHAAVCLAMRAPWWWSVLILALLFPMKFVGRYFYST